MHINKKDLIEFDNGNMNTQEVIEFLSHLDHCDFCLDQMMEQEDSSTQTVAVATPCCPAPVSAMIRFFPMRRASKICPMVLLIL